ncbi:MAG: hypothetical protein JWN22_2908 [Nocardioides sp.]|jgi:hypothetical protein|nr:hypothetical protein [Nocardioides sp.]
MSPRPGAGQLVLRLLVLLGPLVALLATGLVGAVPADWLIALVAALAVAFAAMPDSPFGTAVMVVVLAWWGISLRDGLHPEAVIAAAGLVTAHVAAVLASYGPGSMPLDRAVVGLWAVRGAAVLLASPAVWAVATVLRDQPEPPGIWVAGLAAAFVATLVAAVSFQLDGRP